MRRYAPFFALPLALAALAGIRLAVGALSAGAGTLRFSSLSAGLRASLASSAARAEGRARLSARPFEKAFESPGFVLADRGLSPRSPDPPPGGPVFSELESLKDLAYLGSTVAVGYRCLADTPSPQALQDLCAACGVSAPRWIGAYLPRLEDRGSLPAAIREAWERKTGGSWKERGGGLVLYDAETGEAAILRRGKELGRRGIRVEGSGASGSYSGWFCLLSLAPGSSSREAASFKIDLLQPGRELLEGLGLPESFPALVERRYGSGFLWTLAGDYYGPSTGAPSFSLLPSPALDRILTLDSPENPFGLFRRILAPLESAILATAPAKDAANARPPRGLFELRCAKGAIEFKRPGEEWRRWFVRGVDLGASVPGGWATEPPADDAYYLDAFRRISAAGSDSIRIYTLLPPAFYRALALHNSGSPRPLLFFQGIWLEEDPPRGDLLEPAWAEAQAREAELCVDAVHGRASLAPRKGKSWGEYRIDASPWLAGFLVGREILPEEVEATRKAHGSYRWAGERFEVAAGHPVESFLAGLADRVQSRDRAEYGLSLPIGIVSWPTLDVLSHPGAWDADAPPGSPAPYHDRESLDLASIASAGPEEEAFYAAYHVYPNYPDFLVRDSRYAATGRGGAGRYGAYLADLIASLRGVPLVVAEFGLSTGYGTAHLHPEGLDHGGLTESAQSRGLVELLGEIEGRGAAGGIVFEWSDEWSKKTWTTEAAMIPYSRHALWHNATDPEQNYGLNAWEARGGIAWKPGPGGLRSACDTDFFYLELSPPPLPGGGERRLEIGLDLVPGRAGQARLLPGGPLGPQGSEFKIEIRLAGDKIAAAYLFAAADYDLASGLLFPAPSSSAFFTGMARLTNEGIRTREGLSFPALREDGSLLRIGPSEEGGLVSLSGDGRILMRIPWARLNFSDPSSGRILLDDRPGLLAATGQDELRTTTISDIGVWGYESGAPGSPEEFFPARNESYRAPLSRWDAVDVRPRPKAALGALSRFFQERGGAAP